MLNEIQSRRSIRKYKNTEIDNALILDLIDSARIAPSGSNTQPWHFIIINDEAVKADIVKAANNQKWMLSASVFIACVADIRSRINDKTIVQLDETSSLFELKQIIRDTAIAIDHLTLEAQSRGIGTCWVAWYKQDDIRPLLHLEKDKYVVSIITVGYPDETPNPRPRKELRDIVHYNKW